MMLSVKALNIPNYSTGNRTESHKIALHEALMINRINRSLFKWSIDGEEKFNSEKAVKKAEQAIANVDWRNIEVKIQVRQVIDVFGI